MGNVLNRVRGMNHPELGTVSDVAHNFAQRKCDADKFLASEANQLLGHYGESWEHNHRRYTFGVGAQDISIISASRVQKRYSAAGDHDSRPGAALALDGWPNFCCSPITTRPLALVAP